MATYIALINLTDSGICNARDTIIRAEAFIEASAKFGVAVKDVYWTIGCYDQVVTLESPDDASVAALGLALGSMGNARTQTMRAFNAGEMKQILSKI
jgi:uncharacterized protein with GYD domain